MNPAIAIPILLAVMLLLTLHFDRRHSERDMRAEENSVAAGFKKWLMGGTHDFLPAAPDGPAEMPEAEKTLLRVSGSVAPESWDRLGTALLSNLPPGAHVRAALDVSFAIDTNQIETVTANLNYLISELELSGLRIARVDRDPGRVKPVLMVPAQCPKKSANRRVVIRLRELNPLLQSLLCVSRWPDPSRAVQL